MKRGTAMLNAVIVDDEIPALNLLKMFSENWQNLQPAHISISEVMNRMQQRKRTIFLLLKEFRIL